MANEIKEALKKAVEQSEENQEAPELSGRLKKLLARKKNLQRKTHNPKRSRK
tara:strand:+ start:22 stop:177 length:156 start_codon:yes stop_codon:yes gene_type:complete